ncbi:hypothetical protein BX666DRAFT_1934094 [Dichotomocladium elegans]|nr:hypothetical protein BX666DRAFT_1934094 [Dichotomocladium elegans]
MRLLLGPCMGLPVCDTMVMRNAKQDFHCYFPGWQRQRKVSGNSTAEDVLADALAFGILRCSRRIRVTLPRLLGWSCWWYTRRCSYSIS